MIANQNTLKIWVQPLDEFGTLINTSTVDLDQIEVCAASWDHDNPPVTTKSGEFITDHGWLITITSPTPLIAGDRWTVAVPVEIDSETVIYRETVTILPADPTAEIGKIPRAQSALPAGSVRWTIAGGQSANVSIGPTT